MLTTCLFNRSGFIAVVTTAILLGLPSYVSAFGFFKSIDVSTTSIRNLTEKTEQTKHILNESPRLGNYTEPKSLPKEFEPWIFRYFGPSIDTDLTGFYAFFAANYPEALTPVEPRIDLTSGNCSNTLEVCNSLSHAIFSYGLLHSYYPAEFTTSVLEPLRAKYGRDAIPGVTFETWETLAPVEYKGTVERLCTLYRIDAGVGCVLENITPTRFLIRAQGLQSKLFLPSDKAQLLIKGYLQSIENTPGLIQGRISVLPGHNLTVESTATRTQDSNPTINISKIPETNIKSCDGEPIDLTSMPFLSSTDALKQHMDSYRKLLLDSISELPLLEKYSYPSIIVFDNFGTLDAEINQEGGLVREDYQLLKHPYFDALSNTQLCFNSNPSNDTHGISMVGILLGKDTNLNIGIIPDFPHENLLPIHVPGIVSLINLIPNAHAESVARGSGTLVANISLSDEVPLTSTAYDDLSRQIKLAQEDVLFVVAAGQPKTRGTGAQLSPLCRDLLPACLGHLPNVITVGALDTITADQIPKIWRNSNYGGGVVSIGAPGRGIISTDFWFGTDDSPRPAVSVRDGTSMAAIFVSGLATRLLAVEPHLTPIQVKNRILATASVFEEADNEGNWGRRLFSGIDGKLAAGAIDGKRLLNSKYGTDQLQLSTGENLIGTLMPINKLSPFRFFINKAGTKGSERDCPSLAVRRIVRKDNEKFSIFCSLPNGQVTYLDNVFALVNIRTPVSPMDCLKDQKKGCFTYFGSKSNRPVYFQEINDVLFGF